MIAITDMAHMTTRNRPSLNWIIRIPLILITFITSGQLSGEITPDDPHDRDVFYFGALSRGAFNGYQNDVNIAAEMFFKVIAMRLGKKSEFNVLDDKEKILDTMRNNEMDAVFTNPIDYLDLDPQVDPDYRYTITFGPSPEMYIYLLIPKRSSIRKITQLQGKRLSSPKGYILGQTYLEVFLAKAGLPAPEQFFSNIQNPVNSNAAVLDLFFGKADLAIANNVAYNLAVELNPQIEEKIEILAISDPYIHFVIGVNKRASQAYLAKLDKLLLHLKQEPKIRQILDLFSITDVVKLRDEQLETLRQLKQEHAQLVSGRH